MDRISMVDINVFIPIHKKLNYFLFLYAGMQRIS
jgi:hypothetical protein